MILRIIGFSWKSMLDGLIEFSTAYICGIPLPLRMEEMYEKWVERTLL